MSELTFKTREEYLKYRAEWKAAYKRITVESREAKKQRKEFIWEYRDKGQTGLPKRTKVGPNPDYDSYASCRVEHLRWQANKMLKELIEAKELAGEQRLKRLNDENTKAA